MTIDARGTANIQRNIARELFTDLALLPLYFQMTAMIMPEGVTVPSGGTSPGWNFYRWDKR